MLSSNVDSSGTAQVQMLLTTKDSLQSNHKTSFASSGVLSENERTVAVNNLDSIICKMVDDSYTEMDENMKSEDE